MAGTKSNLVLSHAPPPRLTMCHPHPFVGVERPISQLIDSVVRVKCLGGRELRGTLRGYDELVNLVLDDCEEFIRGKYYVRGNFVDVMSCGTSFVLFRPLPFSLLRGGTPAPMRKNRGHFDATKSPPVFGFLSVPSFHRMFSRDRPEIRSTIYIRVPLNLASCSSGNGVCVMDVTMMNRKDLDDPEQVTSQTRRLGLVVIRGTQVSLVSPEEGTEEIANPFLAGPDDEEEDAEG